MKIGYLV